MNRYNTITLDKIIQLYDTPVTILPNPTDINYKIGYITRFFASETVNVNSQIYEIDDKQYIKYTANPLYRTSKIRWKIIGDIDTVRNINRNSISFVNDSMPNLKNYLLNLTQFIKK